MEHNWEVVFPPSSRTNREAVREGGPVDRTGTTESVQEFLVEESKGGGLGRNESVGLGEGARDGGHYRGMMNREAGGDGGGEVEECRTASLRESVGRGDDKVGSGSSVPRGPQRPPDIVDGMGIGQEGVYGDLGGMGMVEEKDDAIKRVSRGSQRPPPETMQEGPRNIEDGFSTDADRANIMKIKKPSVMIPRGPQRPHPVPQLLEEEEEGFGPVFNRRDAVVARPRLEPAEKPVEERKREEWMSRELKVSDHREQLKRREATAQVGRKFQNHKRHEDGSTAAAMGSVDDRAAATGARAATFKPHVASEQDKSFRWNRDEMMAEEKIDTSRLNKILGQGINSRFAPATGKR